jgi:gliding motility-associated-like protein
MTASMPMSFRGDNPDGALTFVFRKHHDPSYYLTANEAGWDAAVTCYTPLADDAGLTKIVSPVEGGSTTAAVTVELINYGSQPISSLQMAYEFDNGTPVIETFTLATPLVGAAKTTLTFDATVDVSVPFATYSIKAYTLYAADMDNSNDTVNYAFTFIPPVTLYGYRIYDAVLPSSEVYGVVSMNTNNPNIVTKVSTYTDGGNPAYGGAFFDGSLYLRSINASSGAAGNQVQLDISNWSVIASKSISVVTEDMSYDYTTNTMYALSGIKPSTLYTVNLETGALTEIGNTGRNLFGLACDLRGQLYTIDDAGMYCKVDKATAALTDVGFTGVPNPRYVQSMTFDYYTGRLFWAMNDSNDYGRLYELDPVTGAGTDLGQMGGDAEIVGMYVPYDLIELTTDGRPNMCEGTSIVLSVPNVPQAVSYTWLYNGTPVGTGLSYTASVAGTYTMDMRDQYNQKLEVLNNDLVVTTHPMIQIPVIVPMDNTTFCEGGSVRLQTSAVGISRFQWFVATDSEPMHAIPGAVGAVYLATTAGSYYVETGNDGLCFVTSDQPLVVTVLDAPETPVIVTENDEPANFCSGGSVTLIVENEESANQYVWYRDGAVVARGADRYVATTTGAYQVETITAGGCTSTISLAVNVTVNTPPSVPVIEPRGSIAICSGEMVDLIATTTSNNIATYIWYKDGTVVANTRTHRTGEAGNYQVEVITAEGCAAISEVKEIIVIDYPAAPVITADELEGGNGNKILKPRGASLELRVRNAVNDANIQYQWFHNEAEISNATSAVYTMRSLSQEHAGNYMVIAINTIGGCFTASDNTIQLEVFNYAEIANVLTPDGDGQNDYFSVEGLGTYAFNELRIVNRQGNEVYRKKNYQADSENGWKGEILPDGVYFYSLTLEDWNGNKEVRTGYIHLKH